MSARESDPSGFSLPQVNAMSDELLEAHSLAEAHLYLLATPCASCRQGPVRGGTATSLPGSTADFAILSLVGICDACRQEMTQRFRIPSDTLKASADRVSTINRSDKPSKILDVGQWLLLFRMILNAADSTKDKVQARLLGIEAAQCLEEALRFYGDDDDPPDWALFHETTRKQYSDHPDRFSKRRLMHLRSKLPSVGVMQAAAVRLPKKRHWWNRR